MSEKTKDDSSAAVFFLLAMLAGGWYLGWRALDRMGYQSHVVSAEITANAEWMPGETKQCGSIPLESRLSEERPRGYALASIDCGDGPSHTVKIQFYGQEVQQKMMATWLCTRNTISAFNDQAFTCKQTGAY